VVVRRFLSLSFHRNLIAFTVRCCSSSLSHCIPCYCTYFAVQPLSLYILHTDALLLYILCTAAFVCCLCVLPLCAATYRLCSCICVHRWVRGGEGMYPPTPPRASGSSRKLPSFRHSLFLNFLPQIFTSHSIQAEAPTPLAAWPSVCNLCENGRKMLTKVSEKYLFQLMQRPPKNGIIALWPSTNGSIPDF